MAFVIDTQGEKDLFIEDKNGTSNVQSEDESDDDFQFIPISSKLLSSRPCTRTVGKQKDNDIDLNDTYLDFGDSSKSRFSGTDQSTAGVSGRQLADTDKILQKSVLQPGVEKLHSLPEYDEGRRRLLKKRKMEREKSAGQNWFNMKAPEITEEMKNDLEVLKMRSALDSKHFYKKNDSKALPKYFQVGRIMDSAADFYHSRIPKKDRKKTLVDELLADAEFHKSTKKRYKQIIAEQQKTHYKAHRQAKRLKKKKK